MILSCVRIVIWLMALLYLPLAISILGLIGYGCYCLDARMIPHLLEEPHVRRLLSLLLVNAGVLCLFTLFFLMLLPIFLKRPKFTAPEIVVRESQAPNLFRLLRQMTEKLGMDMPDYIVLRGHDLVDAFSTRVIMENGKSRRKTLLIIGAGMTVRLKTDELGTLLCQYLAYAAACDNKTYRLAQHFHYVMFKSADWFHPKGEFAKQSTRKSRLWNALGYPLRIYGWLFLLLHACNKRHLALVADQKAAEIVGPGNTRKMWLMNHLFLVISRIKISSIYDEFKHEGRDIHGIYDECVRRWSELTQTEIDRAEEWILSTEDSLTSLYPTLGKRYAAIDKVEAREWRSQQPATSLFRDWNQMIPIALRDLKKLAEDS